MTAFVVITYIAVAWLVLWSIKNWRSDSRARREQSSWLYGHERDVRAAQRQREADESAPIIWRR